MKVFNRAAFHTIPIALAVISLGTLPLLGQQNSNRAAAELFAVLPDGSTGPEGLTVGADGNVYVTTFGFNQNGSVSGPGQLFVFNPEGRLLRQVSVANSSPHFL